MHTCPVKAKPIFGVSLASANENPSPEALKVSLMVAQRQQGTRDYGGVFGDWLGYKIGHANYIW